MQEADRSDFAGKADLERRVLEAISRVSHRPMESLNRDLRLKEDLGLDSLNYLELEYEIQQGGLPEIRFEDMSGVATISEVIGFLRAK
jgi:acyl carrier protein